MAIQLAIIPLLVTWLGSFWTALTSTITAVVTTRLVIASLLIVAWISIYLALANSLSIFMPTGVSSSLGSGTSLMTEFLAWLAFLKPAGLESYISAVSTSYGALYLYGTLNRIINLKAGA